MLTWRSTAFRLLSFLRKFGTMSGLSPITADSYAERGTPTYRRITYAMFLAGLCLFAQLYFLQPLLPVLGRYFRLTPAHSSLVISTATLALATGLLLGTFLNMRITRKKMMVSALLGSSALTGKRPVFLCYKPHIR
jgi:MFS family permease